MIDHEGMPPETVGDKCYVHYKKMMRRWQWTPGWTTAHAIFKDIARNAQLGTDDGVAEFLAWHVFFALVVVPYEQEKRKENGDI